MHDSFSAALCCALMLAACSHSPVTGRAQFIALPEPICVAPSEIMFGLTTASVAGGEAPCSNASTECADSDRKFRLQVDRIGHQLQPAARELYPELMPHANSFQVSVEHGLLDNSASTASGKIALADVLQKMNPPDDLVAFLIAREMGHVLNRHHAENTSSGVLGSFLIGLVIPAQGLAKIGASFFGSSFGAGVNVKQQQEEADTVALRLLGHAGYTPQSLALSLAIEAQSPVLGSGAWAQTFRVSALRVATLREQPEPVHREIIPPPPIVSDAVL